MNGACVYVPLYVLHEGIIVGVKEGAQRIREVKKCGVFINRDSTCTSKAWVGSSQDADQSYIMKLSETKEVLGIKIGKRIGYSTLNAQMAKNIKISYSLDKSSYTGVDLCTDYNCINHTKKTEWYVFH